MNTVKRFGVAVAALGMVSVASADTVNMRYAGNTGLNTVTLSSGTSFNGNHSAGHLTYQRNYGGGSFNTFCVEIAENTNGGFLDYEIVNLADAPRSDTPDSSDDNYGATAASNVVEIIAKAIDMQWIDINLQAGANATTARMSAIQGKIWAALFGSSVSGSGDVSTALTDLDNSSFNTSTFNLMQSRLRAAVVDGAQDQLYVVPLPTAAWAGLGMLGMCAGVRSIKRRR